MVRTSHRLGRWLAAVAAVGVIAPVTSAAATRHASTAQTTPAPAGDILAEAKRISELAKAGLVHAPTDSDVAAADIVAQTSWLGPTSTPAPPAGVNIQIITCAPGTACETAANYAVEAATSIGWTADVVHGAGTPESFAQAFDTAIAKKPAAIITMAVPDLVVGASLAKAKAAGIITISVADAPNATATDPYDVYVSYRMPLMHQINAYNIIDETGGKANVVAINDSAFPNLVESNKQFEKVMAQCTGCTTKIVDWQITDALDPVKADSAITAVLQSNPDMNYLVMPYTIGFSSVIEAVRKAGKADSVKIVTKDGDEVGLAGVAAGTVAFDAGVSLEWIAYASIDEAIRGITKNEYTPADKLGIGVHLFTKDNTPADGVPVYTSFVDFKTEYHKLWGVAS